MAKTIYILFLLLFIPSKYVHSQKLDLIPKVDSLLEFKGFLYTKYLKNLYVPHEWKETGNAWINHLNKLAKLSLTIKDTNSSIQIEKVRNMEKEAYTLQITNEKVFIKANSISGINHAFATFLQILLNSKNKMLPQLFIYDKPRFSYRGLMIDCSRHYWTVEQLKKIIRQLAFFKLNTLHLHLTDNQGWRLYIDKYPDAAIQGTYYQKFKHLSGKYYKKEELQELIRYAKVYGIDILPEIDLPGHCLSLFTSLPELSCNGGKFETYPEEQIENRRRVGENMLCIGNPMTYNFVSDVIDELSKIFPYSMIHLGGDEVSTEIWKTCPKCQQLYKQQKMASWNELQDFFTKRIQEIIHSKNKKMIGWDEINDRDAADSNTVVMIWRKDGIAQQIKAMKRNISVIMSPKDPCYFDFGYSRNSTRRVYQWEPAQYSNLVLGGQANLWTEFIATQKDLEKMLYPRICALAEVLWSNKAKNWNNFQKRIINFKHIFQQLHINYFKDEDWNNTGFVPKQIGLPELISSVQIKTNMTGIKYYLPQYAFDGNKYTFFSTPYSLNKGDYFTLLFGTIKNIHRIKILFDSSKEYPKELKLLISKDGCLFNTIPFMNKNGVLTAKIKRNISIKAIKIELTAPLMNRLTIKEFILN